MKREPWILGLALSHNGAACLIRGNRIVVAIQEERLSRLKRAWIRGDTHSLAIEYCLREAGIRAKDLERIVFCTSQEVSKPEWTLARHPQLRGLEGRISQVPHHLGHAFSAFCSSGFQSSSVLVIDGAGHFSKRASKIEAPKILGGVTKGIEHISLYRFHPEGYESLEKHVADKKQPWEEGAQGLAPFYSLGGMFSSIAHLLFGNTTEAGKVMGLAPYGKPVYPVDDFVRFKGARILFPNRICKAFPEDVRWPRNDEAYRNLAASAQEVLDASLLFLAKRLRELSPESSLCYAGGVALNSVSNEVLVRQKIFDRHFFLAPAEDSGTALGAAYFGLWEHTGRMPSTDLRGDTFGRVYRSAEVAKVVRATPRVRAVATQEAAKRAAQLLCDGKIIGWFQGGSELGPRALGYRSILCDPRNPNGKELLNRNVKHREAFRPFAPSILEEKMRDWFEVTTSESTSPFMLRVFQFKDEKKSLVPAVVHVDGTGRVQSVNAQSAPEFYDLISSFEKKTGVPIVLNTSFNVMGEPIVETPEDALWCLLYTGLDAVVFPNFIVEKDHNYTSPLDLVPSLTVGARQIRPFVQGGMKRPLLAYDVKTPYGVFQTGVDQFYLPLVKAINGKRSGWELFDRLQIEFGNKEHLIKVLGILRRRKLIRFSK